MNITLLNKSISAATTTTGKSYQVMEVAYKNNTFQGKVEGKKITSYSTPAFTILAEANPGDTFEVTVEKKNGFNEWTALKKGSAMAEKVGGSVGTDKPFAATPSPTSTFETPEERARRQVLIVRQSSLSAAVDTLAVGAKSVKKEEVLALAEDYYNWVFQNGILTGFEDMKDDDPSMGATIV